MSSEDNGKPKKEEDFKLAADLTLEENPSETTDYNEVYEALLERFNRAHALSQKLFLTEKTQRQALYHYKRRNNALLDLLQELEAPEEESDMLAMDDVRLSNLLSLKPELSKTLMPALQIAQGSVQPSDIHLKESYNLNLAVDEMIPDLPNDELDTIELNPQDTDMWSRRNFSHLVVSKFKPAEIRAKGLKEYIDPLARKKKKA